MNHCFIVTICIVMPVLDCQRHYIELFSTYVKTTSILRCVHDSYTTTCTHETVSINLEEMFSRYYMHSGVCGRLKSSYSVMKLALFH